MKKSRSVRQIHLHQINDAIRTRLDAFFSLGTLATPDSTISSDDEKLLADVEATMESNSYGAKFSQAIEDRFKRATAGPRGRLFVRTAILGTILYNSFLIVDGFVVPDVMWLAVPVQLGIVTPITIALIVAILRLQIDPEIPTFICLVAMITATTVMFMVSRSPYVNLFACIFGLFLICGNVALAIGFGSALVFSTMSVLAVSTAILLHPLMGTTDQIFSIAILFAFATYSLAGSYRIEAGVRTAYLFALREGLRARLLDMSNRKLKSLITLDGLTGIGNRRLLDERLEARWCEPDINTSLAFLLIDIDHFKKFNDDHGHLIGDECLRSVAQALAGEVLSDSMTLARYGGEEFAVMIADLPMDEVIVFAERLRGKVKALSIETEGGAVIGVTISIGCASVVPSNFNTPTELIGAADAALYRAKRTGRDRVEIAKLMRSDISIDRVDTVRVMRSAS